MSKKRATRNTKKTLKALKRKRQHYMAAGSVDTDASVLSKLGGFVGSVGKAALSPFRALGSYGANALGVAGSAMGIGRGSSFGPDSVTNISFGSGNVDSFGSGNNPSLNVQSQINSNRLAAASLGGISPSAVTTTGVVGMGNMSNTRGFTPQGGRGSVGGTSGTPAASSSVSAKTAREQAAQKAKDDKVDTRVQNTATRTELAAQGIGLDVPTAAVARTGVDAAGNPITNLTTSDSDVEKIDDRTATVAPDDVTTEAIKTTDAILTKADAPTPVTANVYDAVKAATVDPTKAAQGKLSSGSEASATDATLTEEAVAATRDTVAETAAKADTVDFVKDDDSVIGKVTGTEATVSDTVEAEKQTRSAILGTEADDGTAAEIINTTGYEAAQRRTVKGTAAKGAAAEMLAVVGDLPPDITAAIVEDPATMTAAIDDQPVEVRAAIAALPTEALVSSQMESLLAGMDEGVTPAWARPALAAVEAGLARRGLSASTVGRDALFNSIIQSAMPMAQSNAQALQQRAAQNLSNEQQANLQQSTLDMQRRMGNLSNQQQAASQSATMAQQMNAMQSQFTQDVTLTSAQMQQQTRTQNLQNQQQGAVLNAQQQQATNAQNLGNEQQIELANLQIEDSTARENMTAQNQERLAEMQVAADFLAKNAGFQQQMNLANLSNEQQMRLANLTAENQASSENLSAAQQTELANLNSRMQTNLLQGKIAAEMNVAQLSVDQQRAVQNAATVANIDLTKFNAAQQTELTNSKFMQTMVITDFNAEQQAAMQNATALAAMDAQNADQRTKVAISNAQAFLQMDMANLSNRQQGVVLDQQMKQQRVLSDQSATNASRQFNATSKNQTDQFQASLAANMNQFNASQANAMAQFNETETNRAAALTAQNKLEADKINADMGLKIATFDKELQFKTDSWNAANLQAVEQSNVEWRRKSNTINTAAQNASNQQNAQFAFNMSTQAQSQLWQELRDQATFDFQGNQTDMDRKANIINAALGNERFLTDPGLKTNRDKIFNMLKDMEA